VGGKSGFCRGMVLLLDGLSDLRRRNLVLTGRLVVGARLLAMANEVLKLLYRRHVYQRVAADERRRKSEKKQARLLRCKSRCVLSRSCFSVSSRERVDSNLTTFRSKWRR
jgi:hypothetical protein